MSNDATLTSKGQTTIPKEIWDSLGIKSGDRMNFTFIPDATVMLRVKVKSVAPDILEARSGHVKCSTS